MKILGIHGGMSINQHDPAAAIVVDGQVVAAAEEERFLRIKSPKGHLPIYSVKAVLKQAKLKIEDIDLVVHPGETYDDMAARIPMYFKHYFGHCPPVMLVNHQLAHAASAFFCSGMPEAMTMSCDFVGDRLSVMLAKGSGNQITPLESFGIERSLGLFYAIITSFLGFEVNEGEYKVMGLAPYGKELVDLSKFVSISDEDYQVNLDLFQRVPEHRSQFEPYYNQRVIEILGQPRLPGTPITQRHKDIALAAQRVLESCEAALVRRMHRLTGSRNLCSAGGVALNCSANMILSQLPIVDRMFVQPASSDRGLALGCALLGAAQNRETIRPLRDVYLGPEYELPKVKADLDIAGVHYQQPADICSAAAELLANGKIVGWWQGRSEYGPRALGTRSILADPRSASMKDTINARIKFREEFRPFAPAVLEEQSTQIFEMRHPSPFMTVAFPVRPEWQSKIPAVTHVNGSARVQTVDKSTNAPFHKLIDAFNSITGVPVLLNTSFNVKGEPIVETPLDALATFSRCGMDALCVGPYLIRK